MTTVKNKLIRVFFGLILVELCLDNRLIFLFKLKEQLESIPFNNKIVRFYFT
jgi:hypothetical protein